MEKAEIINEYEIEFLTDFNSFELLRYNDVPKHDKYWKEMIDSGSQGHEYPRPPKYEYHYYTSNEEKCLWYNYLKKTLEFIKKYSKDNKLSLVKNSKFEELKTQIKTNKNWYIKYERAKEQLEEKKAIKQFQKEKSIAMRFMKNLLTNKEIEFMKKSIGFETSEVIAYIDKYGNILIKDIGVDEFYDGGKLDECKTILR